MAIGLTYPFFLSMMMEECKILHVCNGKTAVATVTTWNLNACVKVKILKVTDFGFAVCVDDGGVYNL